MPKMKYFFDLDDEIDETGTELPNANAVPREAVSLVLAVAASKPATACSIRVAVRDQQRRQVYAASLQLDGHWTDQFKISARAS